MKIPFVDLKAQNTPLLAQMKEAFESTVLRGDFILGEALTRFENNFASFAECQFTIGVSSGLAALRLALQAMEVGQSDEVILPANTFIATALAVTGVGATPRLVDCDPKTLEMDPAGLESVLSSKTRAIIPVHLYGQTPNMEAILAFARKHNLFILEDSAQAHGATYQNHACGSLGDAAGFSFFPAKNLGCLGDGGAITTNNEKLAERIRTLRHYGQREKYYHAEKGGNSRLDTLQAAMLDIKLPYLKAWNAARQQHATTYKERLRGIGDLQFQEATPGSTHVWHLFILQTNHRDALRAHLQTTGIDTGIHYPLPIHMQKAYADLGYRHGEFPVTEQSANRMLSLPMFAELTSEQLDHIIQGVRDFFNRLPR